MANLPSSSACATAPRPKRIPSRRPKFQRNFPLRSRSRARIPPFFGQLVSAGAYQLC